MFNWHRFSCFRLSPPRIFLEKLFGIIAVMFLQPSYSSWIPSSRQLMVEISVCLRFNDHFSRWTGISWYQNVSMLDIIAARLMGGGGDKGCHKTCKAPIKSKPLINQPTPNFLQAGCPSCCPTNSIESLKGREMSSIIWYIYIPCTQAHNQCLDKRDQHTIQPC